MVVYSDFVQIILSIRPCSTFVYKNSTHFGMCGQTSRYSGKCISFSGNLPQACNRAMVQIISVGIGR